MRHVLLGGRGILGSGFTHVLLRRRERPILMRPPWASPQAVEECLRALVPEHVAHEGETTLIWAAGIGQVGTSAASLSAETRGVGALADALRSLPTRRATAVTVVFASSAGAVFGGHGRMEITEDTPPRPITAYGQQKLVQEGLLEELAGQIGCRVVSCRISNLYGLAHGQLRPRGLIATAVRCTRLRQPMTVYVSQDTRRDYIYNRDAAALAMELASRSPQGFSTALVREGQSRTVADVLSLVGRVVRREVPVTYVERPETRLQPQVLRFAPATRSTAVRPTPMPTAIHLMARAPMSPLVRSG